MKKKIPDFLRTLSPEGWAILALMVVAAIVAVANIVDDILTIVAQ